MRIVIIGPANPYRGGIAKFNDTLADCLNDAGHEVMIANFSMQYPSILFPGKSQYTEFIKSEYDNQRLINSVNPISWIRTVNSIAEFKPSVAIIRYWTPFMGPALKVIARGLQKKGIRTIAITDNVIPHEKHFFDNYVTKSFLKSIDKVVCMSKKVRDELSELNYNGDVAVHAHPIYNSYNPKISKEEACQKLQLDTNDTYTMFFGFIRDYKGLDILLRAWAKADLGQNHRLIVAGEFYGKEEFYSSLIKELQLENRIILRTEYIPETDVNLYFSAVDLVVQPYRSASQSGISGIAYNYLVPMIVTNVGGLPEIIEDGCQGYVTPVSDDCIASAIEKYYKENHKEEFSSNMKKRLNDFSWSGLIEAILQ